ncbi:hypothetical protein ACSBR2_040567 [Camellia fascicularis]
MEQTNTRSFLSCLCFILFFINSLELITTAKGNPSFVLTNETDHQALLAIKDLIQGDPLGALSSWNHSIHFCNWQGVSCGRRHQRVALLNLSSLALVGSISPQIGNLTFLRRIHVGNNSFHGEIPQELGKLFRLQYLQLVNNSFQGSMPKSLGRLDALEIFAANNNSLGTNQVNELTTFLTSLSNCSNLRILVLASNQFKDFLPHSIANLSTRITWLILQDNYISRSIPLGIGNLVHLQYLFLDDNMITGSIPNSIGKLSMLEIPMVDKNNISGEIPSSIRNLSRLGTLDLSTNMIEGSIPISLGNCTNLQQIHLDYNHLIEAIPYQIFVPNGGVFTNISAFSVVGNGKLCGGIEVLQLPACSMEVLNERKRPFNLRVIVLIVTPTIVLLSLCILAIIYRNKRSKQQVKLASPLQNQYVLLSFGELFQATNGFSPSNLIGEGGYGSVYKGILNSDEQIVVVQVLKLHECGANKSFVTECEALKNLRHRNLVKIITACSSIDFKGNNFKALVFEFMENGSLENWLHPSLLVQHEPKNLNFVQRLNIAIDVACALDYLHHHCEMAFIHCDLKPSNILLDGDLCAHVSDFGFAKIFSATNGISSHQQSSSIGIRETIGYVAPEYGMNGEVSTQGDMYSYGVLLLEMFTRKRPTNNIFTSNVNLHNYIKMCHPEQVMQIVDPHIILEMEDETTRSGQSSTTNISKLETCLLQVIQIGVACSVELPSERMNAKDVLMELHKIRNVFLHDFSDEEEEEKEEEEEEEEGRRREKKKKGLLRWDQSNGVSSLENVKCKLLHWEGTNLVVAEGQIASRDLKSKVHHMNGTEERIKKRQLFSILLVFSIRLVLVSDPGLVSPFFRNELLASVLHFVCGPRRKRGSAGRGLYHERSKEVNLFQIYNMDSGNAM